MRQLMQWSRRHPVLSLLLLFLISAAAGWQCPNLRLDPSLEGLAVENDPARIVYSNTVATFGTDQINVVFIQDENLFSPEKLTALEDLHYELETVAGVERVESLYSVPNFKSEAGLLVTGPLLEYAPETDAEADQIRTDAGLNPLVNNNLVSSDGVAVAINLYVADENHTPRFYETLAEQVDEILEPFHDRFDELFQIGNPFLRYHIAKMMLLDQKRIIPLSMAVLFVTLVITTASLNGAILPFLTSSISILWTLGFMALADIPINILTVIVPSLIIVIGSTEDVHLLTEYRHGLETQKGRRGALDFMIAKMGTVVFVTALTTFLGFLSIYLNHITILRQFGLTAAFGLFVNPIATCIITPVYLRFFGAGRAKRTIPKSSTPGRFSLNRVAEAVVDLLISHRLKVAIAIAAVTVGIGLFGFKVTVQNDIVGLFRKGSSVIARIHTLTERLPGVQSFFIRIDGGHENIFREPETLRQIAAIQKWMAQKGDFDKSISIVDLLTLIHRQLRDPDGPKQDLPASKARVSQYVAFIEDENLSRYVNHDFSSVNIMVRHNINASHLQKKAITELKDHILKNLHTHFKVDITGNSILTLKGADAIADGQARSILLLLAIIFVLMSILFMNVKAGLLSLIPNVIPVAINFGIMGLFNIPLNVGTAMVAVIAIGIAVDDTLHFMTRYNEEMHHVKNQEEAMRICVRSEFRAVFATSISLSLGFIVLVSSEFVTIAQFGLLSAVVMLVAFITDMLVTPILLSRTRLLTLWGILSLKLKKEVIEQSEFFRQMRPWQIKKVVLLSRMGEAAAGDILYREGDPGGSMFLLLEGEVKRYGIQSKTDKEVDYYLYTPGDVFGHIAMLDNWPRSATTEAVSPVKYVEINGESLERLHNLYPRICSKVYRNLARILGDQLVVGNWVFSERGGSL